MPVISGKWATEKLRQIRRKPKIQRVLFGTCRERFIIWRKYIQVKYMSDKWKQSLLLLQTNLSAHESQSGWMISKRKSHAYHQLYLYRDLCSQGTPVRNNKLCETYQLSQDYEIMVRTQITNTWPRQKIYNYDNSDVSICFYVSFSLKIKASPSSKTENRNWRSTGSF